MSESISTYNDARTFCLFSLVGTLRAFFVEFASWHLLLVLALEKSNLCPWKEVMQLVQEQLAGVGKRSATKRF